MAANGVHAYESGGAAERGGSGRPGDTADPGGDPGGGGDSGGASAGGTAGFGVPDGSPGDVPGAVPDESAARAARLAGELRAALGPLMRRLRQFRPDGELTLSQTSALVRLDREGPATGSELAAGEGIRPQSMCTIIGALAERGLVAREPDPADGRRIVVSLTPAGVDGLHGARRERARRLTAAISEELSPLEQEQLATAIPLLERITRRV